MKIAYCSDIHLEFGNRDFVLPDADVLILAGDICIIPDLYEGFKDTKIGRYTRSFFMDVSFKYKKVIYIPGNHEYWNSSIDKVSEIFYKFTESEKITNIEFSSIGTCKIDGVKFIYSTLWTDLKKSNPVVVHQVNQYMRDYSRILLDGVKNVRPEDTMKIHSDCMDFMKKELESDVPVVIISHHAPNIRSDDENYTDIVYAYCCTDCDDMILDNPNIIYWIHGHTHTNSDYMIGSTRVFSNCRGYYGYQDTTNFKVEVLEL